MSIDFLSPPGDNLAMRRRSSSLAFLPLMVAALIVGVGCGSKGRQQGQPSSESSGHASNISCGAKPTGIDSLLEPGALTVFGEMHGTAETPAFVANVTCHAAQNGREVIVGLEIPNSLQGQVDRFLQSAGAPADVEALVEGQFWTFEDGRSSKAMLALLDHLRLLAQTGMKLRVALFDGMFMSQDQRDPGMAANIAAAIEKSPQAVTLILVGNLHARMDSERWMSWHLAKRHPRLRTLNVAYSGGSAWVCTGDGCGPMDLSGKDRGKEQFVELLAKPDDKGYGGLFYLGAVTASMPATHKDAAPVSKPAASSARSQGNRAYEDKDYPACAKLYLEAASTSSPGRS